ncbi:hypothetical protein [Acetivibrio clariflavus]|uniref:Cthe-2314-like HEPN domain-containing protein n=1 Tax=Acetivibrio clariflavus (strain DSM 19732 / NBRC 101661 / EBR45) TaxID=720554 RepID=G8LUB0_ACECE|nr:hypothetical protein [Acetivibrio clariflavus]AEV69542.1 hypothetical protein Clocl_3005 [Acetivibrio clariflavus DSM 19732]
MPEYIYKGKKYTQEEWYNEKKSFIEEIRLPNEFLIDPGLLKFTIIFDEGYSIAIEKFRELYYLIASARNCLINAFNKFCDSNTIDWDKENWPQLWERGEYLKNSIIWYTACEDYIYQIIWFAFDMGENRIRNWYEFENQLGEICYTNIKNKLKIKNTLEAQELLQYIDEYRFDDDVKYMRDELADRLKCRGNLYFEDLEYKKQHDYMRLDRDGKVIFNLNWVKPRVIDIDRTIELLKKVHIKLIDFGNKIKNFIDFENILGITEDGKINGNVFEDKKSYKKIIF